jgi:hypothetical protein
MRCPFNQVPFALPRSETLTCSAETSSRACERDIVESSGKHTSVSTDRPTTITPSRSGITRSRSTSQKFGVRCAEPMAATGAYAVPRDCAVVGWCRAARRRIRFADGRSMSNGCRTRDDRRVTAQRSSSIPTKPRSREEERLGARRVHAIVEAEPLALAVQTERGDGDDGVRTGQQLGASRITEAGAARRGRDPRLVLV